MVEVEGDAVEGERKVQALAQPDQEQQEVPSAGVPEM